MNKLAEKYLYPMHVYFEFYDYREIPEPILEYLLKSKDEVYRIKYEVLFKFATVNTLNEDFINWIMYIDSGDKYRYITIQEDVIKEDLGCSYTFHRGIRINHINTSEIENNPCELKSMVLKDHDNFDMKVKNVV
jgi:hypothetical protein